MIKKGPNFFGPIVYVMTFDEKRQVTIGKHSALIVHLRLLGLLFDSAPVTFPGL
jgi:hypothetical protein